MKIKKILAQEILDSRGNPTIKTMISLDDGSWGWAAVPSGVSIGKYEAVELRDKNPKRYNGLGVLQAVENVNQKIAPILTGLDAREQEELDQKMIDLDGTKNKSNLGSNAILSVSLALARAAAMFEKKPLYQYLTKFNLDFDGQYIMPITLMNLMNGGKHANWATDIQEYMVMPIGVESVVEATRVCAEIYSQLSKTLKKHNYSLGIGDEGGYAPNVQSNEEPFKLLVEAIADSGYRVGEDVYLAIDAAASEFYQNNVYELKKAGIKVSGQELTSFYQKIISQHPVVSLEDIFGEDDWQEFARFTKNIGKEIQIVGDDLYATNLERLERGIREKTTNSILVKPNQIGTLSETIGVINLARKNGMTSIVSHRSGETEDDFIADLSVAMTTGQIKTGAPCRGERTVKYNRLMEIERELGHQASYNKFPFLR